MFSRSRNGEAQAKLAAMGRSQAVIEFDLDGTILTANANFLDLMGYRLDEVRGRKHALFVAPAERDGPAYREFWAGLRRGTFQSAEFRRIAKDGRPVWIQASYNPVLDSSGQPVKIIKFATDVTARKRRDAAVAGQLEAIHRSQAVIEFDLDGTILEANANFLAAMGYMLSEVQGRHHSMFLAPGQRDSAEYKAFWEALRRGEFKAGEFRRQGKGGRDVWIQASYNPILDEEGKPFRVVKFAADITARKLREADLGGQIAAIGKSQAVIEFDMDGVIQEANANFLSALGYSLAEVQGRNHSMFVDAGERDGATYREFWAALRRGEFKAGEFRRLAKGGREVWIQASYNPILGPDGKPYKVVKFASDVTHQVLARKRAEHVGKLMETVAAGAQQLNASVREIASSMALSRESTTQAFDQVVDAGSAIEQLSQAAGSMGQVLEAIDTITGQINLLALNATIESARAGEAGRGFAVVANEVKNLANQARMATGRISDSIEGMQGMTDRVVQALAVIRGSMEEVLAHVTNTSTAVEEQSAVADDMSGSMRRAAEEAARME